ncbi:hypothetical protein COU80_04120 [Candidatus Peregrinibacteria bacterium CG10_big_fil_rev_8_21_14_0_10_55_24]|nr:MAG: hypothetical protein COU80_04120 [Candidatus Peregrinibacteria bacterium CG10_big_fil_rev_8_21_14_0_10_55_24]
MPLPDTAFFRTFDPGDYGRHTAGRIRLWANAHPDWTFDGHGFTSPDGTQYYEAEFGPMSRRQFIAALIAIPFIATGMAAAMHAALGKPKEQNQKSEECDTASTERES